MAPQTNGAQTCYEKIFKPILVQNKDAIQEFIDNASSKAGAAAADAIAQSKKAANEMTSTENLMKAANLAQQAKDKLNEDDNKEKEAESLDNEDEWFTHK